MGCKYDKQPWKFKPDKELCNRIMNTHKAPHLRFYPPTSISWRLVLHPHTHAYHEYSRALSKQSTHTHSLSTLQGAYALSLPLQTSQVARLKHTPYARTLCFMRCNSPALRSIPDSPGTTSSKQHFQRHGQSRAIIGCWFVSNCPGFWEALTFWEARKTNSCTVANASQNSASPNCC